MVRWVADFFESGAKYFFYGVDGTHFKWCREGTSVPVVLEVLEDESDGYRSCCGDIQEKKDTTALNFFKTSIDTVTVREVDQHKSYNGWELVAADGHVWLEFGTDNVDDYYPCFSFAYHPRPASGDPVFTARPDPPPKPPKKARKQVVEKPKPEPIRRKGTHW